MKKDGYSNQQNIEFAGLQRLQFSQVIMTDRQPQNIQMIKSMVHGKPSRRHGSQSAIYDVFTWGDPAPTQKNNDVQKYPQHCQIANYHQQDRECNTKEQNNYQYQQRYEGGCRYDDLKQIPQQKQSGDQCVADQYQVGKHKQSLKPHQVKHALYMYENVKMKKQQQQQEKFDPKKKSVSLAKQNKLNQRDEKDRKIIEMRKQKIKQFNYFTRNLPNSAFTTYYGRPAFESYGRCNSSSQLKTHNVMPHKGQNYPKVKQTYEGALLKGQHIKASDHLPRKPIQQLNRNELRKKQSQIIHLPLEKPDLVNHVRFSQAKLTSDRKQAVPSYESLRKQMKKSKKTETPRSQKNKKNRRKTSQSMTDTDDGLKFMNTRQHLIELIEAKKVKDSRLAYKVTECYPPHALQHTKTESDCPEEDRPAGLQYERGDRAENVIYRRY